ncbi:MAG: ATP-binding cassette domain-containing protein, partial [Brevibacterium sp.]|nr:ATP-binding cassette domain-containing protein [Brevibacterium sp.]
MATVTFDKATRQYPEALTPSVNEISLDIADGEFLVLVGPSGCGKSTLLHLIGGLLTPTAGDISVLGAAEAADRLSHCALMPQGDSLLPWFTVRDNVAVPLRNRGVARRVARERA